ncbi:interleukin-1 receptor-associated kinase 1-binding protein 1 [Microcaecilia unicolor]|uniref:Interleukin-1 receptor-associated kinase 1-binding protein 1 n=1 Tax=Microcaecilia unicolor TaxID=1415580 RepID=A0A6P7XG93_9AMPH|nr:interleukin-1 receptor-associated kinase 1-binding protein 1 [Microcaecilia unicolor]
MAEMSVPRTRVFMSLTPSHEGNLDQNQPERGQPLGNAKGLAVAASREVHVSGRAELSAAPDRARVSIQVSSQKDVAGEAKSSVVRRLEYIVQNVRQQGLKDEDMTVMKTFTRIENAYHMEAEVCITFSDFGKMQNLCNLLVEKLDSSVVFSPIQFFHSEEALEKLRRQVCLAAVGNARRKAQDVCRLVGHALGKPLLIREEELREWECQPESLTNQQKIKNATVFASSKVFVTFEIKAKEKNKKNI